MASSDNKAQGNGGVSRRGLLIGAAVIAGAAGGGGYALWRWRRFSALEPHPRRLAWFLSSRASRLDLGVDDDIVESWIGEHLRHHGPLAKAPRGASDKLLQSLLLSTDLYTNAAPGQQSITKFVSYYDPHKNPCYNPLRGA